ncbi:hypothetical protein RIF29_37855 [Crotalaria pallida]|uniref:Uncharacterized protein n=1 Tax=Crotalaria pallida TaxID=3830 RepID=A0AAN9E030_CROPI
MLAEEAIAEHHHHIKKITFRVGLKKPSKSAVVTDEVLKIYNLHKAETSNFKKPIDFCSKVPNKSLGSAFEGSSSSIPSHIIKKITFYLGRKRNDVADDFSSNKPIKVMGSASEGSSSSSSLHLPPKKKLKLNANDVLKEEASSEKPITFMDSEIVGAEHADFEENDHVLRMKKGKGLKRT